MNLILPISFTRPIRGDKLDYVVHIPKIESRWDIKDLMSFIKTLNQLFKCKMDKLFISILPIRLESL
jgi:hypothetical protein